MHRPHQSSCPQCPLKKSMQPPNSQITNSSILTLKYHLHIISSIATSSANTYKTNGYIYKKYFFTSLQCSAAYLDKNKQRIQHGQSRFKPWEGETEVNIPDSVDHNEFRSLIKVTKNEVSTQYSKKLEKCIYSEIPEEEEAEEDIDYGRKVDSELPTVFKMLKR